jgi:hypothetical protein
MTVSISASENLAQLGFSKSKIVDGVVLNDPYTYWDGTTAERLRSGVDGPHAGLADRLCNINGRLFE